MSAQTEQGEQKTREDHDLPIERAARNRDKGALTIAVDELGELVENVGIVMKELDGRLSDVLKPAETEKEASLGQVGAERSSDLTHRVRDLARRLEDYTKSGRAIINRIDV